MNRFVPLLALLVAVGGAALIIVERRNARDGARKNVGVVRQTEIRIAPEEGGRLASVAVTPGQQVRKGDLLAVLDTPELAASVDESKAAGRQARADRNNVFAGMRKEEIDIAAQNARIAEANVELARQQYERARILASKDFTSKQQLDEATASLHKAEASLGQLQAVYDQAIAGPTKEERAQAEAQVALANAKTADLEATFAKTRITAPADGAVGVVAATQGEVVSPGQAIMTLDVPARRWFSFTVREDQLNGLTVGAETIVATASAPRIAGRVTELRPLGEFATWRAARAVGDHDLNSFLLRVDPLTSDESVQPGMTVWLEPQGSR